MEGPCRFSAGVFSWAGVWYNSWRFVEVGLGPKPQNFGAAGRNPSRRELASTLTSRSHEIRPNISKSNGVRHGRCLFRAHSVFRVFD